MNEDVDDVGEYLSDKSFVVEVDDEGEVCQKEGIDSIMLLYLNRDIIKKDYIGLTFWANIENNNL